MAYEVLARKWRPSGFDAMVGQEHVLRALSNALASNRLHHAYLFTGTRGVGKTTVARILARCLNCETGVTAQPCGSCSSCREISEGRFVDLIEVDAASRSRVEETRDLMENVQYAPTRGRYKVYLIDEVHMLSTASFNALLKTLEEPPPHVKFLLATTDPKKLPVTVLSRCLQFHLKNLTPERIVEHLRHVLTEEQVPAAEDALWALARAADGSMRDALSLTDQAIAFGDGELQGADVARMLGTIDQQALERILRALAAADADALLACCDDLALHGADFAAVLRELMSALHRLAVVQALPAAAAAAKQRPDDETRMIAEMAAALAPEDVQLFYQMALMGQRDLPHAPDPRVGFEMTLLRMLAFQPASPPDPEEAERTPSPDRVHEDGSSVPAGSEATPSRPATEPSSTNVAELDAWRSRGDSPPPAAAQGHWSEPPWSRAESAAADLDWSEPTCSEAPWGEHSPALEAAVAAQQEPSSESVPEALPEDAGGAAGQTDAGASDAHHEPASGGPEAHQAAPAEARTAVDLQALPEYWHEVLAQLDLGGLTQTLAKHCLPRTVQGDQVLLALDPEAEALHADMHAGRLEVALGEYFGCSLRVRIEVAAEAAETPAQRAARERAERQRAAESAIHNDAGVQALLEAFNGSVVADSIRPC